MTHLFRSLLISMLLVLLAACGGGGSDTSTVATPLTISEQPVSVSAVVGSSAVFTVSAAGDGLAYQWQVSQDQGSTWTDIPGAVSASYTVPVVTPELNGDMFRVKLGAGGGLISSAVTLTATPAPTSAAITTQPVAQTATVGSTATFSVTATGTSLGYQWQVSADGVTWNDLVGAIGATLVLNNLTTIDNGKNVRVIVTNAGGSATSAAVQLTVTAAPAAPTIATQPSPATAVAPQTVTFTVVTTGNPSPSYQWQQSTDGGVTYTDIASATNTSYTTPATATTDSGEQFRVHVLNTAGDLYSAAATLTVNATPAAPVVTTPPSNQAVTAPATASFVVVATGTPIPTYQWQLSTDGGATFANINGATLSTYTTPVTSGADSGKLFRVMVTNGTGGVTSSAGSLTVAVPGGTLSAFVGLASGNPETPVDGTGSSALFASLGQISRGSDGNLYAVDGQMIRKVTPAGVVTTIAGSFGGIGTTDGAGATALFYAPSNVVSDASGNLYVSDTLNSTIRKISPTNVVSTFAGAPGIAGYADGTGTVARFRVPKGLAVDSAGNIYVADQGNRVIRKITSAGVVSTFVGTAGVVGGADGTGPAASFYGVESLAFDAFGNLFASDFARSTIRKITPGGIVTTFAGSDGQQGYVDGVGSAARFYLPHGIAVGAAGDVYVADSLNDTIRKITPTGSVTTVVGVKGSQMFTPGPLPASVNQPFGLAFIGSTLYATNGGQLIAVVTNVP